MADSYKAYNPACLNTSTRVLEANVPLIQQLSMVWA